MSKTPSNTLLETVGERLKLLKDSLEADQGEQNFFRIEGLELSREFVENTYQRLTRIVEGKGTDYEQLYKSISLGMIANSPKWTKLRTLAREMCM